eukprot:scpid61109/ scgid1858/ 
MALASRYTGLSLAFLLLGTTCFSAMISFVVNVDRRSNNNFADMNSFAKTTVQSMINRKLAPQHSYLYIPFNLRRAGTAEKHESLQSVAQDIHAKRLSVSNRRTCRGPLLGPIFSALRRSSDNSLINVFTTNLESDGALLNTLLVIAKSKSVQINIFVSTDCRSTSVLSSIAKATGGNLMYVRRTDERRVAEYVRKSIVHHPSRQLVRKEGEMQRGEMAYTYFDVDASIRAISVSVSCNGTKVPEVKLTPPNRINYRGTIWRHLRSSALAYKDEPNAGTWRMKTTSKGNQKCVTYVTGSTQQAEETSKATPEDQLTLEWAMSVGASAGQITTQPAQGDFNLLVVPQDIAELISTVEVLDSKDMVTQLLYKQPGPPTQRRDGKAGTAFGYLLPNPGLYVRVNGLSGKRQFSRKIRIEPQVNADTAPAARTVEAQPLAPQTNFPSIQEEEQQQPNNALTEQEVITQPLNEFRPSADQSQPGVAMETEYGPQAEDSEMNSLLNTINSMEKELDDLRKQLQHVTSEKSRREKECKANEQRVAELLRIMRPGRN